MKPHDLFPCDREIPQRIRLLQLLLAHQRHLHHEETETIALIQTVMTDADWQEIDQRFQEALSFAQLVRAVPWALHGVPAEAREQVFAHTGLPHRVLWWLTRGRFERLDRRAFRHAAG